MSSSRQWLASALRRCQQIPQQATTTRPFSSSAPLAAFKSPSEQLAGMFTSHKKDNASSAASAGRSSSVLQELLRVGSEKGGINASGAVSRVLESVRSSSADLKLSSESHAYVRQIYRRWTPGEVYAPRDLNPTEMRRWRRDRTPKRDILDVLGVNPVDNYRNFSLISEYVTPLGRIKHSKDTGLRPVNQRKMAKAIRRAIGLGIHPSVHKHPEILLRSRLITPISPPVSKSNA
ncbi:ribosomal protein S18 [Podospora didyma]|uniref:Small ribosomal subunit protein bS18m n=1 Tax=Podospora didyma TaxID=330526 RepID=A0AAE0ND43_9PEZI|nr:ribosomal protein S18 [Podospora didyma]